MKKQKGELAGRVALVTGAGHGIGRAIAEALAAEGANIAICGRDLKNLDATVKMLDKREVRAEDYQVDATSGKDVMRLVEAVKSDFGTIDILVNNIGGVRQHTLFQYITEHEWYEVFEANLMSMVHFCQAALPHLRESDCASVINMASVAGKRPGDFNPHYGAMKAAMIHLSKHLSNQWGKYEIRVNAIAPHTVKAGAWKRDVANKAQTEHLSHKKAEEMMTKNVLSKMVLKKIVTAEDVANLAVFLASDRSRLLTGTCITVDGGAVNSIF